MGARGVYCICGVDGLPAGQVEQLRRYRAVRSGFPEFRRVTAQGHGLEHTDDPKPFAVQLGTTRRCVPD